MLPLHKYSAASLSQTISFAEAVGVDHGQDLERLGVAFHGEEPPDGGVDVRAIDVLFQRHARHADYRQFPTPRPVENVHSSCRLCA
jgi:hypothetical protein